MSEQKTSSPVAIITLGGKQHLVWPGHKIVTNRLEGKEGDVITAKDELSSDSIKLKISSHYLGEKVNGLKFKNKVRYIRRYGHRQQLTALEVVMDAAKPEQKAAAKPAEKPATQTEAKKPAAKKTPAKKPAPKKPATKKEAK